MTKTEKLFRSWIATITTMVLVFVIAAGINSTFALENDETGNQDVLTGWQQTDDGSQVYYDESGTLLTGLQEIEGATYYFSEDTGAMQTGLIDVDSNTYYFESTGKMHTGWAHIDDNKYYFGKTGHMLKGWQTIGKYKYYFGKNGHMHKGWQTIGKYRYYFSDNGHMHKGWQTIGKYRYYFGDNGHMHKGWQTIGKYRYYFGDNGHMHKGWQTIGKYRYHFGKNGHMHKGWQTIGKHRYYFGKTGHMLKGWQTIGKYKYFFGDANGHMFKGWHKIKGYKYYFGDNGHMRKGLKTIGSYKYYFNNHGRMCVGLHKNGTEIYNIDPKGHIKRVLYTNKKAIALTYDDGPAAGTQTIVDTLRAYDGAATFFIVGSRIYINPEALRDAASIGCQLANHTYGHKYLESLSPEGIKSQINKCNESVNKYTGQTPTLCRTPGGGLSATVRANVGMPIILWSIDTLDWKTHSASQTYSTVVNQAFDGAIVLMHDLWEPTAEASKSIIPELTRRGYQLVTVEELAMIKGVELKAGEVYYSIK